MTEVASPTLTSYSEALRAHLAGEGESALLRAYEIGRQAVAESKGVLDVVSLHHESLKLLLPEAEAPASLIHGANEFLKHVLSPYEITHRGFREATETTNAIIQFTGILCHEIRTPLTSVLASAGMLEELLESMLGEQERKLMANVRDGGTRIKTRTDELMDIIGFQSGNLTLERKPADLSPLLGGIFQRLEPVVGQAGLQCNVELPSDLPMGFPVDAERLEQVITSLVHNALKFGADGGRIDLRVAGGDHLEVEVRDYGRGIPVEAQDCIFQSFFRAAELRRQMPGLGLGLTLCKEIVAAHGGQISLESREGQGTLVRFVIPRW